MEINPSNVLSAEHASWLSHPVTVQMFKNLSKHRETFVKSMSSVAGDMSVNDTHFRVQSYGIRTVDAVIEQLKSTTKFVEQSTK